MSRLDVIISNTRLLRQTLRFLLPILSFLALASIRAEPLTATGVVINEVTAGENSLSVTFAGNWDSFQLKIERTSFHLNGPSPWASSPADREEFERLCRSAQNLVGRRAVIRVGDSLTFIRGGAYLWQFVPGDFVIREGI